MTATTVETNGRRGGDGDGLRGSAIDPATQAAMGGIMPRKRPNYLAVEQNGHLRTSRSVVEWVGRSRVLVCRIGWRPTGKPQLRVGRPGGIAPLSSLERIGP